MTKFNNKVVASGKKITFQQYFALEKFRLGELKELLTFIKFPPAPVSLVIHVDRPFNLTASHNPITWKINVPFKATRLFLHPRCHGHELLSSTTRWDNFKLAASNVISDIKFSCDAELNARLESNGADSYKNWLSIFRKRRRNIKSEP